MTMERVPTNAGNKPLRRWWKKKGADVVKKICDKAGITYAHFKHVAAGRRRMSADSAAFFLAAAGGELTHNQLMPPKKAVRPSKAQAA